MSEVSVRADFDRGILVAWLRTGDYKTEN